MPCGTNKDAIDRLRNDVGFSGEMIVGSIKLYPRNAIFPVDSEQGWEEDLCSVAS